MKAIWQCSAKGLPSTFSLTFYLFSSFEVRFLLNNVVRSSVTVAYCYFGDYSVKILEGYTSDYKVTIFWFWLHFSVNLCSVDPWGCVIQSLQSKLLFVDEPKFLLQSLISLGSDFIWFFFCSDFRLRPYSYWMRQGEKKRALEEIVLLFVSSVSFPSLAFVVIGSEKSLYWML